MRLFIAINFNDDTRARLLALRNELRSCSLRGKFSLPENLHLTLAFIGEVNPNKLDKIKAILDTVTFSPFKAKIERLGAFFREGMRDFRKVKEFATWYAGLSEDKPLMILQREIEHKLALCGFEMNRRKYTPHITLGREVVTDASPWQIEPFSETVTSIDLMKSERISGKLTYTAIYIKKARKKQKDMSIRLITENKKVFLPLLLLGDEQETMIDKYLERGELFALYDGDVKSVCVVTDEGDGTLEIQNLATDKRYQRQGYASRLIEYIAKRYAGRYNRIILGTGDVPGILAFYERRGFAVTHRVLNYFTAHYDQPIVEDDVLLKDKVYLERRLKPEEAL